MNQNINEMITKYEKKGDFNYAMVTDEMLVESEVKLQVRLPKEYKDYLIAYGHGGIAGLDILGVGLTGKIIFADTTIEYREEGLPNNLVVIENVDEWLMCIDCNTEEVVSSDFDGNINKEYKDFDDYLIDQMNIAIENL